jgi:sugar phosphate permease
VTAAWPRRVFYGWWIVGAGFGLEMLIGALFFHAYGAYVVLLREEFGWSRTLFSAAFAMARAESAIFGPIQGWLTDRFGPRAFMRVGLAILGLGFIGFSRVGSPVTFFLAFFLMAVGAGLGGYLPIAAAIVNWFQRRRALALGLSSSGSAVGGLLTPLVVATLTTVGWRGTALLSGILVLLVGVPTAQIFRRRPGRYSESPEGRPPESPGDAVTSGRDAARPEAAPVDFTPREAMRTGAFWLVSLGHGSALLVVSAVLVHMATHVTERLGYSLAQAATVVALLTVAQIAGHLGGGWAGDRVSKRAIVVGCMVGHATALLLLAMASAYWMVITFAVLHGLAWGTRGPLMAAIRADYFGSAAFGTISGASSMVAMLGMMGGPLVAGILADRTGSYRLGFTVLAVLAFLGSFFFLLARRPPPPLRRRLGSWPAPASPRAPAQPERG